MQVCWSSRQLIFKWPNAGRCTPCYKHVTVQPALFNWFLVFGGNRRKSAVFTQQTKCMCCTLELKHRVTFSHKCVRLRVALFWQSSSVFTFISSFRPDFLPNMSSSSSLTSCSPYWLSCVSHKQARLHFKGNDLCPLKWMNEGPYLCRSELQSAARCYFGLMRSSTLNSTHDYYYHGSFAANQSSRLTRYNLFTVVIIVKHTTKYNTQLRLRVWHTCAENVGM